MSVCLFTEVKWQWAMLVLRWVTTLVHYLCLMADGLRLTLVDFPPNSFSCHFWKPSEFLRKTQKHIYLANGGSWSDFSEIFDPKGVSRIMWLFFTPRVSAESSGNFFPKNYLSTTFGGHFEFLREKHKCIYL